MVGKMAWNYLNITSGVQSPFFMSQLRQQASQYLRSCFVCTYTGSNCTAQTLWSKTPHGFILHFSLKHRFVGILRLHYSCQPWHLLLLSRAQMTLTIASALPSQPLPSSTAMAAHKATVSPRSVHPCTPAIHACFAKQPQWELTD